MATLRLLDGAVECVIDGVITSAPAAAPVLLVDRTPLSARVRDAKGRVFGVRLDPEGPTLTGDGFKRLR
ncbi:MAG: hypothetical protein AAGB51_02565 [Planctomycetota bacterium]